MTREQKTYEEYKSVVYELGQVNIIYLVYQREKSFSFVLILIKLSKPVMYFI